MHIISQLEGNSLELLECWESADDNDDGELEAKG